MIRALLSAALLAAPAPLFAWGSVGHRVIARLAYDRLSDQARQGVDALMGPGGLEQVAACPDAIDHQSGTIDCGPFRVPAAPNTRPWHYINLPISESIDASSLMSHCPGDGCVVAQIRKQGAAALSSTGLDQKIALMYLVHFIGDIHQPLHCGEDNDAGGNAKWVLADGKQLSLHQYWDHLLTSQSWDQNASEDHLPLVRELEQDLQHRDVSAWTSGDLATQAALESYEIAKDTIYPRFYDSAQKGRHRHGTPTPIDDQYRSDMAPIVHERLERAGVRLAAVLERLFGPRQPQARPMDLRMATRAVAAALGEASGLN